MEYFRIREICINIIIPLLQHDSVTSASFIRHMKNMLTVCMLFHCLDNLVIGCIFSQQTLIVAGNNFPIVCNDNRSVPLDTVTI